ncbi:MAG: hypothetical protein HYZ22_16395 [Chloroflexi bacterium]|nr:hypothetical protein [Chloroflexota bacterium]
MSPNFSSSLERAILETLAYSDVFDYPLTLDELHRYLTYPAAKDELLNCLMTLRGVALTLGYYSLPHRTHIVDTRLERESASRSAFRRALVYGRILGRFPFVRMVAMTGSLAVLNLSKEADMDYMLVTTPERLWLARAFAVTFGRFMRLFGDKICVNVLVSESALEWDSHDLYAAREICQMIPITGMDVYLRLREANAWVANYLPNAKFASVTRDTISRYSPRFLELPFRGKLGDLLETWAMDFQVKKITHTYGTGAEARFSSDLCQGNFHNHHAITDRSFRERLALLADGETKS